jgi:MFS family permease
MRLLDVHAAASAGDILVVIGLLATIVFSDPVADARARVALFLAVTMVPFAVIAPLIGPLLDRFRHGRRFALSASLFLRAVLAWIISVNVDGGLGLYVAAFGVVLLSRTYGVARSAALARLVTTSGLRLSQAAARAAVFATVASAIAAVFGGVTAWIGPQWPLRLASLIFAVGAVIALSLPPLADTEPPEALPRPFGLPWRGRMHGADGSRGESILSGRLIGVAVLGSGALRLLYGFLVVFLAFAIRSDGLGGGLLVVNGPVAQMVVVGSAFGLGTLIATVVGMGLRVSRPVPLQATGIVLVALAGLWATVRFSFLSILVLCLCTAVASGLAKVAVDATIQERIPERDRANAFARTETLLMLVWLAGAAIGLAPGLPVRLGIAVATLVAIIAMAAAIATAWRLRTEVLRGGPGPGGGQAVGGQLLHRGAGPLALPAAATTPVSPAPSVPEAPPGYHVFRPTPPDPPEGSG